MRFALKAIPLGVLGVAAALLVSCGNGNGLLSGSDADGLRSALADVQSACSAGRPADAADAARRFSDRVAVLSPRQVDPRLIANLARGAQTLDTLVVQTCTTATTTPTTPTTTETTTPSTGVAGTGTTKGNSSLLGGVAAAANLPFTGVSLALVAVIGLGLLLIGVFIRLAARHRRGIGRHS